MIDRATTCQMHIAAANAVRGTNPLNNTYESITNAIDVVDCCRENKLFDVASELVVLAKTFPITKSEPLKSRIKQQCELISKKDHSRLPSNDSFKPNEPPPIWIRGMNFAKAMARWGASGCKMVTTKEIGKRLAICQSCDLLVNNICTHAECGCNCNDKNHVMNKLALESEKCPLKKW